MAIEVYKILLQESPSYLHDLIKIIDTKYCFSYDNIAEIPLVRTTRYGQNPFDMLLLNCGTSCQTTLEHKHILINSKI